jgi:hypothetical protein
MMNVRSKLNVVKVMDKDKTKKKGKITNKRLQIKAYKDNSVDNNLLQYQCIIRLRCRCLNPTHPRPRQAQGIVHRSLPGSSTPLEILIAFANTKRISPEISADLKPNKPTCL